MLSSQNYPNLSFIIADLCAPFYREISIRELFLNILDEPSQQEQFKVTPLSCKIMLFDILPTEKFAKLFVGLLPEDQVELYQALRSDQQAALREHLSEEDQQVLDAA